MHSTDLTLCVRERDQPLQWPWIYASAGRRRESKEVHGEADTFDVEPRVLFPSGLESLSRVRPFKRTPTCVSLSGNLLRVLLFTRHFASFCAESSAPTSLPHFLFPQTSAALAVATTIYIVLDCTACDHIKLHLTFNGRICRRVGVRVPDSLVRCPALDPRGY